LRSNGQITVCQIGKYEFRTVGRRAALAAAAGVSAPQTAGVELVVSTVMVPEAVPIGVVAVPPEIVAKVSRGLGPAMKGESIESLDVKLAGRGW